jgi:hypothetical protein
MKIELDDNTLGELHKMFEEVDGQITVISKSGFSTSDITDALDNLWEQVIPIEERHRLQKAGKLKHRDPIPEIDEETAV